MFFTILFIACATEIPVNEDDTSDYEGSSDTMSSAPPMNVESSNDYPSSDTRSSGEST